MRRYALDCVLLMVLVGICIGIGMNIQAVMDLHQSDFGKISAELSRTTAERDRLLEHLADVESGTASPDCIPIMIWACPAKGDER